MKTTLRATRAEIAEQFKNGAAKCLRSEIKPRVSVNVAGESYFVRGNTGNVYHVEFIRKSTGEKIVECSCPTANGILCYHAAAAYVVHFQFVASKPGAESSPDSSGDEPERFKTFDEICGEMVAEPFGEICDICSQYVEASQSELQKSGWEFYANQAFCFECATDY